MTNIQFEQHTLRSNNKHSVEITNTLLEEQTFNSINEHSI